MQHMMGVDHHKPANDQIELPPGFRFHPTDEELITHYLCKKVTDSGFRAIAIGEADLNKSEPWDLPKKANIGENEWYFFCLRDKKYPTGLRTNRATQSGYWKATGKDKEIYRGKFLVGMKKTLVFYKGRAPKGVKSNWVMHEYRLEGKLSLQNLPQTAKTEWVISRIFEKSCGIKKSHISTFFSQTPYRSSEMSQYTLPTLTESSQNSKSATSDARLTVVSCFSNSNQDSVINSFNNNQNNLFLQTNQASNLAYPTSQDPVNYPNSSSQQNQHMMLNQLLANSGLNIRQHFKREKDSVMTQNPGAGAGSSSMGPVDLDSLWNY